MKLFSVLMLLLLSTTVLAEDVYGLRQYTFEEGMDYLNLISNSAASESRDENYVQCSNLYKKPIANGIIDIRYALGYFDLSEGAEFIWEGENFGISPSLDIGVYQGLIRLLTAPCPRRANRQLCEFQISGSSQPAKTILQKRINLLGHNVTTQITLTHASVSQFYKDNVGPLAADQQQLTAQSENNFFNAIGVADIVLYNGHSRSGGGPDFSPPRLNSELHTDYKQYYSVQKPGLKKLLAALKRNSKNEGVLGLLSCSSKSHFYSTIMKANSNQRLIVSSDFVEYNDSIKASLGYLEGFLQGQCGNQLEETAKQEAIIKTGFFGINLN
ncbi:MAG: hypothetical protein H7061_02110 [Bdellovibrionaceae bacterium]|nr:hypothetical protein [Bdellovibrio sp.]